jgi:hypothetical protein
MTTHALYAAVKEHTMANGNGNGLAKFTPGPVAEVIAIAGPGEEVPSTRAGWENRVKYRLVDGRPWWAPLRVRTLLFNLGIEEGEPFRCCLQPYGSAGQSAIDIKRCPPAAPVLRPAPPTPIGGTQPDDSTGSVLEAKLKASIAAAKRPEADEFDRARVLVAQHEAAQAGAADFAAQAAPATPNGHKPPAPYLMTGAGQAVLQHYTDAVDIVIAVRKYATLCGLDFGPTSFEDVRCMAATSRINAQGGR